MAAHPTLWKARRTVGRAYGVRRALAVFVLARTTPSRGTAITWLLTMAGLLIVTVGIAWGLYEVAPAHDATLSWSTGIGLGLLSALGFVSSALSQPPQPKRYRFSDTVTAVVTLRAYACRVDGEGAVGILTSDIATVRWISGVVALQHRATRQWYLYPAEIFPTRSEWRELEPQIQSASPTDPTLSPSDQLPDR